MVALTTNEIGKCLIRIRKNSCGILNSAFRITYTVVVTYNSYLTKPIKNFVQGKSF